MQTSIKTLWDSNIFPVNYGLLVRDHQSISHNEPRPSQHKNVDIIPISHYLTYYISLFRVIISFEINSSMGES